MAAWSMAAQREEEPADVPQAQRHQRRCMPNRVARRVITHELLADGLREITLLGRLHGKSQLNQIDYSIHTIGAVRHKTGRNALLPGMQWQHWTIGIAPIRARSLIPI